MASLNDNFIQYIQIWTTFFFFQALVLSYICSQKESHGHIWIETTFIPLPLESEVSSFVR